MASATREVHRNDRVVDSEVETLSTCPLCNQSSFINLATPTRWIGETFDLLRGRIGLMSCQTCELVFTNPRPSNRLLTAFYSGDTYECHNPDLARAGGLQADVNLGRVTKFLSSSAPKTLLDFGCGAGGVLLSAQQRGWDAHGFEPGARGIKTCRANGLTVTSDLSALPRDYFSVITLHHVFEHLPNPIDVLSMLRPLLRPDGRLLIEVPNVRSLRARLAVPFLSARLPIDDRHRAFPIHLMYYFDRTLREMVHKGGWGVETTYTLGLGLEEYFVRRAERSDASLPRQSSGVARHAAPRLRHLVRDVFLGLGAGENLVLIACPDYTRD